MKSSFIIGHIMRLYYITAILYYAVRIRRIITITFS